MKMAGARLFGQRGEGGFTLIEAIIAVGLLAVVLSLVTTSLRVLSASWDRGAERAEAQDMIARAVDVISRDISGMRRVIRDGQSKPAFVFEGGSQMMRFVAVEPAYPSEPGPYVIELDARSSRDGRALVRSRSETAGAGIDIGRAQLTDGVALIEGNYAVSFAYLSEDAGRVTWSSSWTSSDQLPAMVEIKIEDKARKRLVVPPLRIRPIIDAEHVCARVKSASGSQGRPQQGEGSEQQAGQEGELNEDENPSRTRPVPEASGQRDDAASRTSDKTKKPEEDEAEEAHPQICSATAGGVLSAALKNNEQAKADKAKSAQGKKGEGSEGNGAGGR